VARANVEVEIRMHPDALDQIVRKTLVAIERAGQEGMNVAKQESPKRTGHNMRSISYEVQVDGVDVRLIVSTASGYGGWLAIGTGIYGPRGQPIRPKRAKVLAWKGEDGKVHFAKEVKGFPPDPYMNIAYEATKKALVRELEGSV